MEVKNYEQLDIIASTMFSPRNQWTAKNRTAVYVHCLISVFCVQFWCGE